MHAGNCHLHGWRSVRSGLRTSWERRALEDLQTLRRRGPRSGQVEARNRQGQGGHLDSGAVSHHGHARLGCARGTTVEGSILLHTMPHDANAAGVAGRRQRMDRTLEAIEGPLLITGKHLKRLVIIVPADFTASHRFSFLPGRMPGIPDYRAIAARPGITGTPQDDLGD